jgi:hydroxyethylthiazole kinase
MSKLAEQIANDLSRIRQQHPLIHHITNLVVMNDTANLTLHLGALPVMAHAVEEMAEMTRLAGVLLLNQGTLSPPWIEAMFAAGREAGKNNTPIVLDPVGAGATTLRTQTALRLLDELPVTILRGNAGEIGCLGQAAGLQGMGGEVRGVESIGDVGDPVAVTQAAARHWSAVVAITGKRDILSDGRRVLAVDNGHRWLTTITGTGCMATTAIAAFAAVEPDPLLAAAGGLACFGLAAEQAAEQARGPASFKVALLDAVYALTAEQLAAGARVIALAS